MIADRANELLRQLMEATEQLRRAYETRTPTIVHRDNAKLDAVLVDVREYLDLK